MWKAVSLIHQKGGTNRGTEEKISVDRHTCASPALTISRCVKGVFKEFVTRANQRCVEWQQPLAVTHPVMDSIVVYPFPRQCERDLCLRLAALDSVLEAVSRNPTRGHLAT